MAIERLSPNMQRLYDRFTPGKWYYFEIIYCLWPEYKGGTWKALRRRGLLEKRKDPKRGGWLFRRPV